MFYYSLRGAFQLIAWSIALGVFLIGCGVVFIGAVITGAVLVLVEAAKALWRWRTGKDRKPLRETWRAYAAKLEKRRTAA